jgi:hypothetical protein
MTKKVFSIDTQPGVQRDGTYFDKNFYTDGRWVRFQRGRPRKIGGFRAITNDALGYSRGIYVNSADGLNQVFNGYNNGLEVINIDNNGVGSGVSEFTLSNFTASDLNLWQFDSMFDAQGSGNQLLLAHPGVNLAQIDQTVSTPVLAGDINGTTMAQLEDTSGPSPSGDPIEVSGGVVVLHPYVFVYGDNGLIKNCAAGNPYDWNGADANETNVASTKVVKGLPVRGGSNAPSGLFWSLDSLIRVSYNPTTITVGGTPQTFYWRYDIISSQSSILSSQSVIEYDGIYYWIGVDRFLLYNGVVKEIPNSMNQNYFFDNLNYSQRQKVWATKVPRFGEIWWFFPSGDSEECNDCVIYNIRENCWYDGGQALGARRTAGYFSQVFSYPINAGATLSEQEEIFASEVTTTTSSPIIEMPETNLVGLGQLVIGDGIADNSLVIAIAPSATPNYYSVTLSEDATASDTVTATFNTTAGRVTLWQHEVGVDEVNGQNFFAIESYFETSDLGWVGGGPATTQPVGDNYWLHLERVEPDFIQSGTMSLRVVGRPFAQSDDKISDPYFFEPETGKIDMREQRRELRLRFASNVAGGNYQMGRVLLNANVGDVRPYGG